MKMSIEFCMDDCWVLLSIPNNPIGGLLHEIIGMSDAVNHAIPTEKELLNGLNKGLQAGFIELEKDRFYLTSIFKEIHTATFDSKGGLFTKIETLFKLLRQKKHIKQNEKFIKLAPNEYKSACQKYSEEFMSTYES